MMFFRKFSCINEAMRRQRVGLSGMSTVEGYGDKGVKDTNMSLIITMGYGSGLWSMVEG